MKDLNKLSKKELIKKIESIRNKADTIFSSDNYYQILSKITNSSIILNNELGDIIEVNDAACHNLGYTREELLKMNIGNIDPGYQTEIFNKFWKDKPNNTPLLFQTIHRKKDGTLFPVEISATAFTEEGKRFIAGISRNITKRKESETILHKSEAQLSNAMEIAQLGYWEYNVDEDYFTFNDQFYSIFRTTAKKVGGYKVRPADYAKNFLHPDDMEIIDKEMKSALETKDPDYSRQMEHRIIYDDGKVGYITSHFFVVKDKKGRTIKTYGANQDITKRKKAELAVIESEKRLFAILNNLQGLAYKCMNNRDWTMEYISAGCKFLTGYDVHELIGDKALPFNEIIHPDYREQVWSKIQKALEQKKQYSTEYKIITKEKEEKWVVDRGSGTYNDQGEVTELNGLITDITHLKLTELELEKSEESYRSLFNGAVEGIVVIDVNTAEILYVNPAICSMLDYSENELKNLTIMDIHPEDNLEAIKKGYDEKQEEKKVIFHSLPCIRKDKSIMYADINSSPTRIDNRKCYVGFYTDVTQRIRQEAELKILSRAVNQAPALILITDKAGNIEYVNPKFTEVTGYTPEDTAGKNPRFLKSGNYPKLFYKEMWETILSGKVWSGEIVNRKKNKELYWESALISPVTNSEGKITHFVAIKEDITEKKKTEFELIRAKEKAEESDKLKSAFLANMSHEIRTPMNGIIGFSNLLTGKNISQKNTEYYKSLITESSNQLLSIVNNIIEISKIESDQVQVDLSTVDLNNLLNKISILFEKDVKEKGLDFKVNIQLTHKNSVTVTDDTKVRQIITNLMNNALKFTKEGFIEIGAQVKNDQIQIYIKDTGIGISKNISDIIFERFRQAEEDHTREYGGTGLGLSISKAYVEMLGGEIWIESVKNEGATCYFTLPCEKCRKKEKKIIVEENITNMDYNWSDYNILIVDDEPLVIDYFREILGNTKIKMHFAVSGKETISIIEKNSDINLVLLDIRMPVMDGFEVFKRIKALRPDLPVIAQTSYAFSDDRTKILSTGFSNYITKPIHQDLLYEKINTFLT